MLYHCKQADRAKAVICTAEVFVAVTGIKDFATDTDYFLASNFVKSCFHYFRAVDFDLFFDIAAIGFDFHLSRDHRHLFSFYAHLDRLGLHCRLLHLHHSN